MGGKERKGGEYDEKQANKTKSNIVTYILTFFVVLLLFVAKKNIVCENWLFGESKNDYLLYVVNMLDAVQLPIA